MSRFALSASSRSCKEIRIDGSGAFIGATLLQARFAEPR
jgi:hypothetical protein